MATVGDKGLIAVT